MICLGLHVAAGWGYAACLNSTEGLEFAAGVEHAPGKAGYPASYEINESTETIKQWFHIFSHDKEA